MLNLVVVLAFLLSQAAIPSASAAAAVQSQAIASNQSGQLVAGRGSVADKSHDDVNGRIDITKLPPIEMAEKAKSRWDKVYDWGPWASNFLLVLVGFLQVLLLKQTRKEIHMQADLMSRQARDAREQHRAKLEVLFPPGTPAFPLAKSLPDADINLGLQIRVANYGYSEAFKVKAWGYCITTNDPKTPVTLDKQLIIPSVINKMVSPTTVETTDAISVTFAPQGSSAVFKQKDIDPVLSRVRHLRLLGVINYVDVYGDAHESPFDFLWVVKDVTENGVRVDKSGWLNQSPPTR